MLELLELRLDELELEEELVCARAPCMSEILMPAATRALTERTRIRMRGKKVNQKYKRAVRMKSYTTCLNHACNHAYTELMQPAVGSRAPGFALPDQHGRLHSLSDSLNQWVVLYFYPKDDTPGCTVEACGFRDRFAELSGLATVLGVSADSTDSHKAFEKKFSLPFTLLSDPERRVISAYGATKEQRGKRITFLIDPEGIIAKIYKVMEASEHAMNVIADLKGLIR